MSYHCFNCKTELELSTNSVVGRKEECPNCKSDMHCCLNCEFYDPSAYNECRETQAERVLDKDRGNFCDYFKFQTGLEHGKDTQKSDALSALDDLFK